jgi:outer membrane immunogenic protein
MKRILMGAAIASMLSTGALAADLAPRMYTKAPVAPPVVYDWTGFYIGGNVGYSWGRSSDTSTLTNGAGTVLFTSGGSSNLDGVIGGGQIGYNWEMQNWLFGLEADIQGADERGSRSFTCGTGVCTPATPIPGVLPIFNPGPAVPVTLAQKIDWFGTVRGRIGLLATPSVLLYGTGGLAYGGVNTSETIGAAALGFSNTDTRVGWTLGAGIEGALGGGWSAKLEYLYMDLGKTSDSSLTPIAALGGGFISSDFNSRITDNILRVGVNYKFGGPVVARY